MRAQRVRSTLTLWGRLLGDRDVGQDKMTQIGLWRIDTEGPHKLSRGAVELESYLEEWIEHDPSLLLNGLTIAGRQMYVEGGRLDLLALDPLGRWVLVEIKSGVVSRETIAQALDYASCVATMPYGELAAKVDAYLEQRTGGKTLAELLEERQADEEAAGDRREVLIFVVGTGRAPGLERMVEYLSQTYGMPISIVSYQVFEMEDKQRILARELTEFDIRPPETGNRPRTTVADVGSLADRSGTGKDFRKLFEAAEGHGLYPRAYLRSVMYAPPTNHTRTLYTVRADAAGDGRLRVYVETPAFAEFYPITEEAATEVLGQAGWRSMTTEDVNAYVTSLERLFEAIEQ